jgi:hypothetical protein
MIAATDTCMHGMICWDDAPASRPCRNALVEKLNLTMMRYRLAALGLLLGGTFLLANSAFANDDAPPLAISFESFRVVDPTPHIRSLFGAMAASVGSECNLSLHSQGHGVR